MINMSYAKKYTTDAVLALLAKSKPELSMRQISDGLGCSTRTTKKLLRELRMMKKLIMRNVGTDKKPMWMYSVGAQ